MSDVAVRAENLSKLYRIGERDRYFTLRDTIMNFVRRPLARFSDNGNGVSSSSLAESTIWALKDVSFEVKRGEVVGIIGRNGAGKSTLLKILSRITQPTEGEARIYGRVGSLLEVGTGFHPELTGRENIYLNGAILGMKKAEIDRKFDEIVAFAEVEKFIDTPVKHYSSGMYMRLAFSVAAHLESEILIVDEVLAVGDAAFQNKCLGKMGDVAEQGRTILFVSHNDQAVRRLCKRCIWLDEGCVRQFGPTSEVLDAYLRKNNSEVLRAEDLSPDSPSEDPSNPLRFLRVAICDSEGKATSLLYGERPYTVEIEYEFTRAIQDVRIGVLFSTGPDVNAFLTTDCDSAATKGQDRLPGRYIGRCEIPAYLLAQGRYRITVWGAVTYKRQLRRRENTLIVDVVYTEGWLMEEKRNTAVNPRLAWRTEQSGSLHKDFD
jgi:lipopolysaccharide transport system ATP-binding protein